MSAARLASTTVTLTIRMIAIITAIDGMSFATRVDLLNRVSEFDAGDEVELTIERDGEERVVQTLIQPIDQSGDRVGIGKQCHHFALPARPRGNSQTMAITAR